MQLAHNQILGVRVSRALEIAVIANLPIKFYLPEEDGYERHKTDVLIGIESFVKNVCPLPTNAPHTDFLLKVEVDVASFEQMFKAQEHHEVILNRIQKASAAKRIPFNGILEKKSTAYSLVKNAIERLGLPNHKAFLVMRIAEAITRMSYETEIRIEYIAEAIGYVHVGEKQKEVEYLNEMKSWEN